jgi:diguanylate cyclase (GGDEF)-like protein
LNELRVEQLRQELSRKAVEGKQAADVPRDVLTQLPNREAAEARLGAELALANPSSPLVVIFLDLDDFKPINDGLGHDAGDKVLVSVAAFLRSIAESRGGAYRLAGDEFIIVLPSTSVDEARVFGERVRAGIEELRFSGFAESVTSSVGAAVIRSGGATFKGAVKAADALMYQSKRRSRNTVTVMEFDGGALSNEESAARAAAEVPSKT